MTKWLFFSTTYAVVAVVFMTVGFIGGSQNAVPHSELVDRGLAIYCPQTGEFAFVGECE